MPSLDTSCASPEVPPTLNDIQHLLSRLDVEPRAAAAGNAGVSKTIFETHESNVRSYCRAFPAVFSRGKGALLQAQDGARYIDFFAGAGALNYGHNPDFIKTRLLDYISADGLSHGLDFHTPAKCDFIDTLYRLVLAPKGLDYKMQFCGPTGTNAVEAAFKIARKVTGRSGIFSFMGGYHGMSLGSLAATANRASRAGAGVMLGGVQFMPYPHGFMAGLDTLGFLEAVLLDSHSGVDKPAAIIVETVQAEGGVVVAPVAWLQQLRALCERHGILLICDEIQVGCYRTGSFFSFERAGITPDIVTLSKSIGGYGLPMSMVLLKPELDVWQPGEHNGTFRGNQLAFVAGAAALQWAQQQNLPALVARHEQTLRTFLTERIATLDVRLQVRGLGLMWGIDFSGLERAGLARRVSAHCFEHGLLIETCGRGDAVLKFLPPLTIEADLLDEGCAVVERAVKACLYV